MPTRKQGIEGGACIFSVRISVYKMSVYLVSLLVRFWLKKNRQKIKYSILIKNLSN